MTEQPPQYPFPADEVIWHSLSFPGDFDPTEDSYFALARCPEEQHHEFNGRVHRNPYRLVIRSPVRGSTSFFVNEQDADLLLAGMAHLLADSDQYRGDTPEDHLRNHLGE